MKQPRPLPPHADTPPRPAAPLAMTAAPRPRRPITSRWFARRRLLITGTKWLLPIGAAGLLAAIAFWPDLERSTDNARFSIANVSGEIDGARLKDARYHGVDEKGRPYSITAAIARQITSDQMELTEPKGDLTQEDGTWLMLKARRGVFTQKTNRLDLRDEVTLYRDDGTTLTTARAAVDIKEGSAVGEEPVHVEGPFGTLDAQGFALTDKGAAVSFSGPAHVVLNGDAP